MTRTLTLVCFMLVLCSGGLVGSQDLPPGVLADLYLLEATTALENGEPQQAIQAFEKIETLDIEPPLVFLFFYGKILVEHGTAVDDWRKGQALLKQFILNIERDADQYVPTLKLLSVAGKRIEKAELKARMEKVKAKVKRRVQRIQQRLQQEQAAAGAAARQRLKESLPLDMVRIPGGTFMMGCTEEQSNCRNFEKPVHRVRVPDFEISKYEVTREQWDAMMYENSIFFSDLPSDLIPPGACAQCPASVIWEDIQVFLEKLNTLTGKRYRLPTEAEWEYAARGGQQSRGYEYAGSDTPDLVAWYRKNSGKNSGERTHPVGQKAANELGVYDMSGNVSEWVADCWNDSYRGAPSDGSAWTRGDCDYRMVRGGSWIDSPKNLRSASRDRGEAGDWVSIIGFRVARTLTP